MLKNKAVIFLFILTVILVFTGLSHMNREMVIMLAFYSGDVKIVRGNDTISPELDMIIRNGDRIITGNPGTAEIFFEDSTSMVLESSSDVKIENAVFSDNDSRMVAVKAFFGKIVTNVRKKVTKGYYVIKTPQAEVNVKGTIFITEVNDNKETYVTVLSGTVWMKSLVEGAREFVLSPQFQGFIKEGMENVQIEELTDEEMDEYKKEAVEYLRDKGIIEEIDLYLMDKMNMDVNSEGFIYEILNRISEFIMDIKRLFYGK